MSTEGNNQTLAIDGVERLKLILEHEQGRIVSKEEAVEVAQELISFFEALADNSNDQEVIK